MDPQALLIGGIIGVVPALIVAFVTAYLNQKAFRDELGASEFVEHQIKLYQEFWFELSDINYSYEQLIGELSQVAGNSQKTEALLEKKFTPIMVRWFKLDKYYIILPIEAITQLNTLKDLTIKGRQENSHIFEMFKEFKKIYDLIFKIIRENQSLIINRKIKVSSILAENPDVTFPALKELMK